jgi:alpha-N-acetylglucosaminidase
VKYRFFFNYCTFGYTMPFWNWREWERCIDWMALNGINMPLAITGSEKILMEVWKEQGFTQKQILGFFTDAAHLPWYHMNTISRWGGPCPESYVEYGYKLQKKNLTKSSLMVEHSQMRCLLLLRCVLIKVGSLFTTQNP